MIKHIVLALTFAAICSGAYAATYKDGTYTGEGNGNASKIQVEVVVSGGKISSVKVLSSMPLRRSCLRQSSRKTVRKVSLP